MRDYKDQHTNGTPVLEFTGTDGIEASAEDYALYAAQAMNKAHADDTEFIADGPTVTAYVHGGAHYSATFTLDTDRGYPYPELYEYYMDSTGHLVTPAS